MSCGLSVGLDTMDEDGGRDTKWVQAILSTITKQERRFVPLIKALHFGMGSQQTKIENFCLWKFLMHRDAL